MGAHLESLGYAGALDIGLISATLGLIAGAFVGGMVSGNLINKKSLSVLNSQKNISKDTSITNDGFLKIISSTPRLLKTILFILLIMFVGREFNKILLSWGVISPDYLPTMIFAILFVTLGNKYSKQFIDSKKISLFNNASLQIFIAMTIMSIDAKLLLHFKVLEVLFILSLQIIFIILFAKFVFFKVGGENYDSATLTSGFIGCGLGATPVGLANMETITNKYGPSYRAFLLLPLLGSVFTDLTNAVIINFFLQLI